jgi:hypothetical protein
MYDNGISLNLCKCDISFKREHYCMVCSEVTE